MGEPDVCRAWEWGTNQPSAMRLHCCSRGSVETPCQCLGRGQAPTQLLPELPCRWPPERFSWEKVFANRSGMDFLIPLPGVTPCLYSPHSFGGVQCLQVGKCLAEDRPQCEDLSHTSSEKLESRMS